VSRNNHYCSEEHQQLAANPVVVKIMRGRGVESQHRGIAVAAASSGETLAAIGDVDAKIFPRSMIKPIEAVALVVSGALDRYGLGTEILALGASSQFGERIQVELLTKWAAMIEVRPEDIRCGAYRPFSVSAAQELILSGHSPTVFHNNNCGKHLAYLTMARHFGCSLDGYLSPDHEVQRYVTGVVGEVLGWSYPEEQTEVDACGAVTRALPSAILAQGLARMTEGCGSTAPHSGAASRVLRAMTAHPRLVSGTGRLTSWLVELTEGRLVVKGGSEGGQMAISRSNGVAALVKVDDGAHRAAEALFIDFLLTTSMLSAAEHAQVLERYPRRLLAYDGSTLTGSIDVQGIPSMMSCQVDHRESASAASPCS
jgi:L-asparaginase II